MLTDANSIRLSDLRTVAVGCDVQPRSPSGDRYASYAARDRAELMTATEAAWFRAPSGELTKPAIAVVEPPHAAFGPAAERRFAGAVARVEPIWLRRCPATERAPGLLASLVAALRLAMA